MDQQALSGDKRAFGRLVELSGPVFSLTYRMLGNAEAEDAVEAFLRLFELAAIRPLAQTSTRFFRLLITIVLTVCASGG